MSLNPLGRVGRILSILGVALAVMGSRPAIAQDAPVDARFGIVEAYVNSSAASEARAGYTRVILRWDVIQPASPDDWKPANVPDPLIAGELAAGREIVAVLIGTPAWASSQGGQSSRDVPDMFHWEAFVRRMAQHYRGRIRHWIIWNEPDVWDESHPGNTWAGTEKDYYQLLKVAYGAIKGVDPDQRVLLSGLTYYWDWEHGRRQYLDRLLEVIASDPAAPSHSYYFDAVLYHLYFNPVQTAEVLEKTRQTLQRYGLPAKPIWINETNAPPSHDSLEPPSSAPRFQVTLAEQAAFVIQEFSMAFSSGAARVEVYKLRNTADHPESIEPFGLLRADDSRRPAFAAYRVAATHLAGFQQAYRERRGDVVAVTFDRGRSTTTVLWTMGRASLRVRIPAISSPAILVDETGAQRSLPSSAGSYLVELPGASCTGPGRCMIGGAPRLIVEDAPPSGRQALPSLASLRAPTGTVTGLQPESKVESRLNRVR